MGANPLFLTDEELYQATELMFFAYRSFIAEADQHLQSLNLGRAHHRVLYFVGRKPDLPVSHLLDTLKITKQSLSRVLRELIAAGYIKQYAGKIDKRQRLLSLTEKGKILEAKLSNYQRTRLAAAYKKAGVEAVDGFKTVMLGLIECPDDVARFNAKHS